MLKNKTLIYLSKKALLQFTGNNARCNFPLPLVVLYTNLHTDKK